MSERNKYGSRYCPECGKIAFYSMASGVVSCPGCGKQYKIGYIGVCPEQFYEEDALKEFKEMNEGENKQ